MHGHCFVSTLHFSTIYTGYLLENENRDGLICIFLVIKKKMSLHAFCPETRYCHSALLAGRSAAT